MYSLEHMQVLLPCIQYQYSQTGTWMYNIHNTIPTLALNSDPNELRDAGKSPGKNSVTFCLEIVVGHWACLVKPAGIFIATGKSQYGLCFIISFLLSYNTDHDPTLV